MPRELKSKEEFQSLLESALEIRIVKDEDHVKLKIRAPEQLYTLKTTEEEARSLTKGAKAAIVEL